MSTLCGQSEWVGKASRQRAPTNAIPCFRLFSLGKSPTFRRCRPDASATVALAEPGDARASPRATRQDRKRIRELERDLLRKDRALAEKTALLVLSKKVAAIFPRRGHMIGLEDRQVLAQDTDIAHGEGVRLPLACETAGPRFAAVCPARIVPMLADECVYLASESSFA